VRRGAFLAIVQAPVPTIASSGPPLHTLVDWFVRQPGVPPHLAAQVRAIGDPAQTLPIPIRFDEQTATRVAVDGVRGLAIGDETGIGSTVVWTKGGVLYAVGGTLAQSALLTIANDLR
jgi:anti-sigma factor RsiW